MVVDALGGVAVDGVSIVHPVGGKTDVRGYDEADLAGLDPEALRVRLEPAVVGLLAGPFAEERFTGRYDADRAAADLYAAASLGLTCLPEDVAWEDYERGLSRRARDLVHDHWSLISELAAALTALGEMTGAQVDAFLHGRMP